MLDICTLMRAFIADFSLVCIIFGINLSDFVIYPLVCHIIGDICHIYVKMAMIGA